MLQAVQYQKNGEVRVEEFPAPNCHPNGALVKTIASVISVGTEKASVKSGQSSLLAKAKAQPDQVKQVLEYFKKEGLKATINKVANKLDSYKQLGYSAAGIVVESNCDEFRPGDRVACAGAQIAVHAEYISVPKNLMVKIPDGVDFAEAAYSTVGSIALQGVRQADLRLNETAVVIGLGLLGLITIQLLKASGIRAIGMDISEANFNLAKECGAIAVLKSSKSESSQIKALTDGLGADAVIITAGTESNEPIEMALDFARKKGKVVIVGAVSTNLPRSPFYEKELDIKISCSYGPGRYDSFYEEQGIDYPAAYVRWTENRNMRSILDLEKSKAINLSMLTTHTAPIEKAPELYSKILSSSERFVGVVLKYSETKENLSKVTQIRTNSNAKSDINLGFIGAGAFAQSNLLPHLKSENCKFNFVTTATAANAKAVASHWGFEKAGSDSKELIGDPETNLIFCASRHDSHADYILEAIKKGKPIFMEKPLCVNVAELDKIIEAYKNNPNQIMVGFNRRFSKPFKDIDEFFKNRKDPFIINYRVNAGFIPKTHWIQAPNQGGRIVGEACHFIDCAVFLTKSLPIRVYAETISTQNLSAMNEDNAIITLKFADGSIANIIYASNADGAVEKEYCEVFCENSSAIMKNFKSVEFYKGKKVSKKEYDGSKGHKEEVKQVVDAFKKGMDFPISYKEIIATTKATFAALASMHLAQPIDL